MRNGETGGQGRLGQGGSSYPPEKVCSLAGYLRERGVSLDSPLSLAFLFFSTVSRIAIVSRLSSRLNRGRTKNGQYRSHPVCEGCNFFSILRSKFEYSERSLSTNRSPLLELLYHSWSKHIPIKALEKTVRTHAKRWRAANTCQFREAKYENYK